MSRRLLGVCLICATAACGRREAPPPPLTPQLSGTLDVFGLAEPVRVVRDRAGIPHIYARNQDDLFFAQGYVQAQDRLFQMDLWRRSVQGRLAEVLGPNFAERDAMTRRVQPNTPAAAEWPLYAAGAEAIARAFVRGINTYVALARSRPPESFALAGWTPELWYPQDLLNRTDAFVAGGDALEEILRSRIVDAIGARRAAALFPHDSTTPVPRGLDPQVVNSLVGDAVRAVGAPPFFLALAKPVTDGGTVRAAADVPLDARIFPVPSRDYVVHLNAPGWNVIGATPPWLPGVASGHNEHVAWRLETVRADTQDVYVEKLNPADPHEVDSGGRWARTTVVKDALRMRGRADPFVYDREYTPHGVVVAIDRQRNLAFTVRWSGVEPGAATGLVALALDRLATAQEIRESIASWKVPPLRIAFEDATGERGVEIAGVVPRRRGWNGSLPAPAWTGENEWAGFERTAQVPRDSPIARLARGPSGRADALLADLRRGTPDARALVIDALADTLRGEHTPTSPVLFSHLFGVTPAARRRFDVGPLPAAVPLATPFSIAFTPRDWDRSTMSNAPGQSESPDSAHYADLARAWVSGRPIQLPFTDAAVQERMETTLTLTPMYRRH